MPRGRPTKYNPQFILEVEKYLKSTGHEQTHMPKIESFAEWLGVHKDTLYEWAKIYPDFSDSLARIMQRQAIQLIDDGIYGGKDVNSTIVKLLLQNNHGMRERTETEVGGIMGEDGKRSEIGLFINTGQGFVPATISLPAASNGSITEKSAQIQSSGMAQKSKKNLHSDNGTSKASTS